MRVFGFNEFTPIFPETKRNITGNIKSPSVDAVRITSISIRIHPSFSCIKDILFGTGIQIIFCPVELRKGFSIPPAFIIKFILRSRRVIERQNLEPIFEFRILLIFHQVAESPELRSYMIKYT